MSVDAVATPVKERPILFSGEMVKAILDGRKVQTRRTLKVQPLEIITPTEPRLDGKRVWLALTHRGEKVEDNRGTFFGCRYGEVGERLWVRETWRGIDLDGSTFRCQYGAGGELLVDVTAGRGWLPIFRKAAKLYPKWRPAIHIPREASRIQLEVTEVRVQRLQEISEEDALAEGLHKLKASGRVTLSPGFQYIAAWPTARAAFEEIWDGINRKRAPWASNPWVWAITFKRIA